MKKTKHQLYYFVDEPRSAVIIVGIHSSRQGDAPKLDV